MINNNHRRDDFENCTQNFIQSITNNAKCSKEIIFFKNIKFNLVGCCQNTLESKITCDNVLQIQIQIIVEVQSKRYKLISVIINFISKAK